MIVRSNMKSNKHFAHKGPLFYARHFVEHEETEEVVLRLPKSLAKELKRFSKRNDIELEELVSYLYEQMDSYRSNQKRIEVLEEALDAAIAFIYDNELDRVDELKSSKHQIKEIKDAFDKVLNFLFENESELRQSLVNTTCLALEYWEKSTGQTKLDFVEQSKIWKAYLDRGTYQTRTFDKYLSIQKLPKRPNWKKVLRTAQYVLENCPEVQPEKEVLEKEVEALDLLIRSNHG